MDKIKLELLEASYLEHFKHAKDLSFIYQINHPKRKRIEKHLNEITKQINELKKKKNK